MTDKHLSTQFDAELSGISTRVLEMGGLVESQVAPGDLRADAASAATSRAEVLDTEDTRQPDGSRDRPRPVDHHRAAPADGARPAPADRDLQDDRQPRARRRRGGAIARMVQRIINSGVSSRLRLPVNDLRVRGRPRRRACCARRSTPSRAWTSTRAVEVLKEDDLIDQEFDGLLRKLITYMMEDPRTISSQHRPGVRRQGDRARRRPRQEHRRVHHLHRQGHRRAPHLDGDGRDRWSAEAQR